MHVKKCTQMHTPAHYHCHTHCLSPSLSHTLTQNISHTYTLWHIHNLSISNKGNHVLNFTHALTGTDILSRPYTPSLYISRMRSHTIYFALPVIDVISHIRTDTHSHFPSLPLTRILMHLGGNSITECFLFVNGI